METNSIYFCCSDTHTNEKPITCPHCEYSFTTVEYLNEHTRTKHAKANPIKSLTTRPDAQACSIKEGWTSNILANVAQAINQGKMVNNPLNPIVTTIITPSISMSIFYTFSHSSLHLFFLSESLTTKTSGNRGRPSASAATKSTAELKCTFLDCNFTTMFQEKLGKSIFSAAILSLFKCICCRFSPECTYEYQGNCKQLTHIFCIFIFYNFQYKCPLCAYVSMTIIGNF